MKNRYVVICEADGYFYSGDPNSALMSFTDDRNLATQLTKAEAEEIISEFTASYRIEAA